MEFNLCFGFLLNQIENMMNKEELKIKLDEVGLTHLSEQLVSLSKISIRFTTTKSSDEKIPIGASKVGGVPDLPANYLYPTWKNIPLSFLAQINLADISNFESASVLPSSGILSFFYSATQETWGFDPKDKGSWQVYYFANPKDLQRIETLSDVPEEGRYQACTVSFFEELTLPPFLSLIIENLKLDSNERKKYIRLEDILEEENQNKMKNRILGYPDAIQNDMQIECQMVSNGIYYGDGKPREHPRYKELEPGAEDWELILQLDSEEENAKMIWGDVGRVYFWIHKKDLNKLEFEKAWFQLQCY
jgi:uncharacterized protein YwqG